MKYDIHIEKKETIKIIRRKVIQKAQTKSVSISEYVGLKLQLLRKDNSVSQVLLAENIGLTRASIVNIEQGRQAITLKNLEKICLYFKISSQDILPF